MGKCKLDSKESLDLLLGFCVWAHHPEMRWFRKACEGLGDSGLLDYDDEIQKRRVEARLVALGLMYNDFCYEAWGETYDWGALLDAMELPGFSDTEALKTAAEKLRPEVHRSLVRKFGDEETLLASLLASKNPDVALDDLPALRDQMRDELADEELMSARMFVLNGMPDAQL